MFILFFDIVFSNWYGVWYSYFLINVEWISDWMYEYTDEMLWEFVGKLRIKRELVSLKNGEKW